MFAVYLRTFEMTFGRNSDCDFIYQGNAQGISGKHFAIYNYTEFVYLVDYSTHGSFVNGIQVPYFASNGKKQVLLQNADRIHVGSTRDLRKKTN
jgi:predicted component of type VI protein secretion system